MKKIIFIAVLLEMYSNFERKIAAYDFNVFIANEWVSVCIREEKNIKLN